MIVLKLKLKYVLKMKLYGFHKPQLVELFNSTKQNISLYINNIFREGELAADSTVKKYLTVQMEGLRNVNPTKKILTPVISICKALSINIIHKFW